MTRLHVEEEDGSEGADALPVLLLHGLTATHRYVVMGSRHLSRGGRRVLLPDARGHGASDPAPDRAGYGYDDLADDVVRLLDEHDVDRAVLAGASMGAHTAARVALHHPGRVAGLVLVTPALIPEEVGDPDVLRRWEALAEGLRDGGVDGFLQAYGEPRVAEGMRETVVKVMRQRLSAHEHPDAVADALAAVPASRAFDALEDLRGIEAPTTVVGSNDGADPDHPFAVAERWAGLVPDAELRTEEEGRSPLAWQGGQLSRVIEELAARAEAQDAR